MTDLLKVLQIARKEKNQGWDKIQRELENNEISYTEAECKDLLESFAIENNIRDFSLRDDILEYLEQAATVKRLNEISDLLADIENEYKLLDNNSTSVQTGSRDDKSVKTDDGSVLLTIESDKKRGRDNNWRKSANMILQKIVDHRAGNAFLKITKDKEYAQIIKSPISLDIIKSRIRDGKITTIPELHRDVMHMLANQIMYNPSSENRKTTLEMMEFVDSEMHTFLVNHQ